MILGDGLDIDGGGVDRGERELGPPVFQQDGFDVAADGPFEQGLL